MYQKDKNKHRILIECKSVNLVLPFDAFLAPLPNQSSQNRDIKNEKILEKIYENQSSKTGEALS